MKIAIYIIIVLALAIIGFNATKLDFSNLFEGESQVAAIGIIAAACVILLMLILKTSRKIAGKK